MSESPIAFSEKHPTARKSHKCCECHGFIQAGEKYEFFSGVWEGRGESFKTCLECSELRKAVNKGLHHEDMTPLTELYQTVMEGRDRQHVIPFLTTKRKRGAEIPAWMLKIESEVLKENPTPASNAEGNTEHPVQG
jgi:hypothetical protein